MSGVRVFALVAVMLWHTCLWRVHQGMARFHQRCGFHHIGRAHAHRLEAERWPE